MPWKISPFLSAFLLLSVLAQAAQAEAPDDIEDGIKVPFFRVLSASMPARSTTRSPAPVQQAATPQPPVQIPTTPESANPSPGPVLTVPEPLPVLPAVPVPTLKVAVKSIQVTGSTVFSAAQLTAIVQPYAGQSMSLEMLRSVADKITQQYLNLGYLTSRAVLTEQTIQDGVVQIRVIEGSLERIDVVGTKRVSVDYVRRRIEQGAQKPLNQQKLEDQLRLLKLDPLFENVEAALKEGTALGQSILTVRVAEAPKWFGNINLDNDSVPSVGGERIGLLLGNRNLTGRGDTLYGSYNRSLTGGADLLDIGYQIPLNPMQGTLQLRVAPSRYRITQREFAALGIEGSSALYDVGFRQPLSRSPRQEVAVTLGVTHRTGKTLIADFLIDQSTTTVLRFGQEWLKRDPKGVWSARSQFNLGTGLLGATRDRDPDGQFFSWTGQAERVQLLNADNTLMLQSSWQLTPNALLPSQQFVIGGRQSLRGFRQNQRSGDNGVSLSIEEQFTMHRNAAGEAVFQLAPFFDAGMIWNDPASPSQPAKPKFLAGLGLGLVWKPTQKASLRLDYAVPLVRLADRGNNLQDAAFYFSWNYRL
jgi:hemolysin activation/secretion protein